MWLFTPVSFVLAVLSLRGIRWAYMGVIMLALLYFPASVGFRIHPRGCELTFSARLALFSLTNYAHIVLFALFFVMSVIQVGAARVTGVRALACAAAATLIMGALVELAEGLTGTHHCRVRDLIPDSAGMLLGAGAVALWTRLTAARAP